MIQCWQPGYSMEDIKRFVVIQALGFFRNNKTKAAEALGISIRTIDAKLEEIAKLAEAEKMRLDKMAAEARARHPLDRVPILAREPEQRIGVVNPPTEITAIAVEQPKPEKKKNESRSEAHRASA